MRSSVLREFHSPSTIQVDPPGQWLQTEGLSAGVAAGSVILALLLWPALLNGYPLIFADTGTYLSQAIHHYVGWDRPAFYSIFLFALHWKITNWSVIVVQAGLTIYVLDAVRRGFVPEVPQSMLLPLVALLCVLTPLPWFVDQIMPDLFTSLLALVIAVLILTPERFSRIELRGLTLFSSWMIAAHLSNIWIALGLVCTLVPARHLLDARKRRNWRGARRPFVAIMLALLVLCTANLATFGLFSISPFGNVFILARLVYDGPGRTTLEHDCASRRWRLCGYLDVLPPHPSRFPTSDYFLWEADGPVARLGGAKRITAEARQIILSTVEERPVAVLESGVANIGRQFLRFQSGDGLNAWPDEVGPVIEHSFPAAEYRAFQASRQSRGRLGIPTWLGLLHASAFWGGLLATIACLVVEIGKRQRLALLCATILLCLIGNAAVTGALSGPHDRYQNRVIWLAMLVPLMSAGRAYAVRRSPAWTPAPAAVFRTDMPIGS